VLVGQFGSFWTTRWTLNRNSGERPRLLRRPGLDRTDHLVEVAKLLGWRSAGELELKELDQFLAARALEHDSPALLFRLGCDYLRSAQVIRPGPEWMSRRVATAREMASGESYQRVGPLLDARMALRRSAGVGPCL
jgi:hypothetical protein